MCLFCSSTSAQKKHGPAPNEQPAGGYKAFRPTVVAVSLSPAIPISNINHSTHGRARKRGEGAVCSCGSEGLTVWLHEVHRACMHARHRQHGSQHTATCKYVARCVQNERRGVPLRLIYVSVSDNTKTASMACHLFGSTSAVRKVHDYFPPRRSPSPLTMIPLVQELKAYTV